MSKFIASPEAENDIFEIWRHLFAEAGAEVANRIESEILESFSDLASTPGKGHRRPDLTNAEVLFFGIYAYLVVYRRTNPVQIIGVLHGRRNLKRILRNRD